MAYFENIYHDKVGFIPIGQVQFNISKLVIMNHVTKNKQKTPNDYLNRCTEQNLTNLTNFSDKFSMHWIKFIQQ